MGVWLAETANKTTNDEINHYNNGHKGRERITEKNTEDYSLKTDDWMDDSIADESDWMSNPAPAANAPVSAPVPAPVAFPPPSPPPPADPDKPKDLRILEEKYDKEFEI